MKIERVLLFTLLVALIFIATIVLFVFKTFSPSPAEPNNPVPQVTQPTSTDVQTTATSSTPQLGTDNHSPLDGCIELKSSQAAGKQYERGSLLVTFPEIVRYNEAVEIVNVVGARAESSSGARDTFNTYHWLTVYIPSGEEFKWQCLFEATDGVRRASLNSTFNLRQ